MPRKLSLIDRLLTEADRGLKTLLPGSARAARPNPAEQRHSEPLDAACQRHIAGLMRINHTGEVCAQALYQGQALTARSGDTRGEMHNAAREEIDHLAWCEQRLRELHSRPSLLNPLFYAASFALGAATGAAGDRISLGFVSATEDQVCEHLREHLRQLPLSDERSRAIIEQMLEDEMRHGEHALAAGGEDFPGEIKRLMTAASKVMTVSTYYL